MKSLYWVTAVSVLSLLLGRSVALASEQQLVVPEQTPQSTAAAPAPGFGFYGEGRGYWTEEGGHQLGGGGGIGLVVATESVRCFALRVGGGRLTSLSGDHSDGSGERGYAAFELAVGLTLPILPRQLDLTLEAQTGADLFIESSDGRARPVLETGVRVGPRIRLGGAMFVEPSYRVGLAAFSVDSASAGWILGVGHGLNLTVGLDMGLEDAMREH
ncbi:MAG: hypothetical protein U0271_14645 [Polyangiaceae bacterium]